MSIMKRQASGLSPQSERSATRELAAPGPYRSNEDRWASREQKTRKKVADFKAQAGPVVEAFLASPAAQKYNGEQLKKWARIQVAELSEDLHDSGLRGVKTEVSDLIKILRRNLNLNEFVAETNARREQDSIQTVKNQGQKIAMDARKKVQLLQKLGLNGAEFHALCLMIKQQV